MNTQTTARQIPFATMAHFRPVAQTRIWSVTLTGEQMAQAEAVAERIHSPLRRAGVPDGHGAKGSEISLADEVGGHAGELAVSLMLGVPWTGGQDGETASGPDVGERTQVRTLTRASSHRLLVRPHDLRKYGNVPFVLVRQHEDKRTFTILGWCMGREVFDLGQQTDGGHSNRPPVWLVDPKCLHHIRTLRDA